MKIFPCPFCSYRMSFNGFGWVFFFMVSVKYPVSVLTGGENNVFISWSAAIGKFLLSLQAAHNSADGVGFSVMWRVDLLFPRSVAVRGHHNPFRYDLFSSRKYPVRISTACSQLVFCNEQCNTQNLHKNMMETKRNLEAAHIPKDSMAAGRILKALKEKYTFRWMK